MQRSSRVLRLPVTPAGRDLLRFTVQLARGWRFGDGTNAEDHDWDALAVEVNQMCADMERDQQEVDRCNMRSE